MRVLHEGYNECFTSDLSTLKKSFLLLSLKKELIFNLVLRSHVKTFNSLLLGFFPPLGVIYFSCLHSELNRKANLVKNSTAKIELLGSYDPEKQRIIKDPYYVSIYANSQAKYFQAQLRCFSIVLG